MLGTKAFSSNLYIALCAYTTLFAKTTTAKIGQDVLHTAGLAYLLAPNDATPQAFVSMLVSRVSQDFGDLPSDLQERERMRQIKLAKTRRRKHLGPEALKYSVID